MKTIALFGGTGGLGKKLVPLLAEKYHVIPLGSSVVDITNLESVKQWFSDAEKHYNVDIVLNMSGVKYDTFLSKITSDDVEDIDKMLDVNIKGNINMLAACLPHMIERGYGRVIAISSVFSEMNVPKNSIYCASKAFVDRLIGTANKENVRFGITCNTIQLGYWDGGMAYRVDEKYVQMAKDKVGLKRFGTAEELYNTVNFIVDNEYVSGTNLKIDGGL
jgi:NAD(P)-dependent dehydrogenase (short-subunit alcohol dehydrogenase family)